MFAANREIPGARNTNNGAFCRTTLRRAFQFVAPTIAERTSVSHRSAANYVNGLRLRGLLDSERARVKFRMYAVLAPRGLTEGARRIVNEFARFRRTSSRYDDKNEEVGDKREELLPRDFLARSTAN